ncbi:transaldolase family protein, partial [Mycobacteroides abscessus]|uniref:transaldolase family protein n=1 Tax=Mycobacteroides abscessus TaxID=36809 RepID=UPI002E8DD64D
PCPRPGPALNSPARHTYPNSSVDRGLEAVADHGVVTGNTIAGTYDGAHAVFHELTRAGIDLDDVFEVLETEGVEKFEVAWNELIDATQAQLDAVSTQD